MTEGTDAERLARIEERLSAVARQLESIDDRVDEISEAFIRARGAAWVIVSLAGLAAWIGWPAIRDWARHVFNG